MRGNPFVRLAAAVVVLLLLSLPVWRLTQAQATMPMAVSAPAAETAGHGRVLDFVVSVDYETKPLSVEFAATGAEGKEQDLTMSMTGKPAYGEWKVSAPASAKQLDVKVTASWPDTNRHALRITTLGANLPQSDRTVWLSAENPSDAFSLDLPEQN